MKHATDFGLGVEISAFQRKPSVSSFNPSQ